MKTLCIIGLGNEFREDDGVGLTVARCLQKKIPDQAADLFKLGNRLFEIPQRMKGYPRVVIIDALPPGATPGNVVVTPCRPGNFIQAGPPVEAYSLHDLDLFWQLHFAFRTGFAGEGLLIGVEACSLSYRQGLSPQLRQTLPQVVDEVSRIVQRFAGPKLL